jgi:cathepsin A (carboxypeptidase C)
MLGVDPSITSNFSSCNHDVGLAFQLSMDRSHQTQYYIGELLERGVRVLIYVGEHDWTCNWVGNERWTLAMEWSGHEEFAAKELGTWKHDGKVAGKLRTSGNLTFLTIAGAGHMVSLSSST